MQTLLERGDRDHVQHHAATIDESLLERIRGEYDEMPGLSLTLSQAERLWQLERETCRASLNRLVQQRVLAQTARGCYVRRED